MAITIDDISQAPTTQCALVINAPGQYVFSSSAPVPELTPTTVLIKVYAVAINPVDAKMVDLHGSSLDGCIGGYDFAGSVFSIGSEVDTQMHRLKLGCRVAGVVLGGNPLRPDVGAFCQYVLADPRFLLRIPDVMSFEKAASLGVAVATVGMALYQSLGIEMPSVPVKETGTETLPKEWALVLGGSTACGTMAIQMLKLSGYKVITTASPSNFALVHSYGADFVIDYHSPTYVAEIRDRTTNSLCVVLDCVSDNSSMTTCYEAIGVNGGRYTALNPFPMKLHTRDDVKPHWIFILTMFGQPITIKGPFKRSKPRLKDVEFETKWFERVQVLLDQDRIQTHPVEINNRGLEALTEGINEVRLGKVPGRKLVYIV